MNKDAKETIEFANQSIFSIIKELTEKILEVNESLLLAKRFNKQIDLKGAAAIEELCDTCDEVQIVWAQYQEIVYGVPVITEELDPDDPDELYSLLNKQTRHNKD